MTHLGTSIAILDEDRVLLIKRRDVEMWALPGGHIDAGETAMNCAIREAKEETGLTVGIGWLVALHYVDFNDGHLMVFAGHVIGGELKTQTDETIDAAWFPVDALPGRIVSSHIVRVKNAANRITGALYRETVTLPADIKQKMPQEIQKLSPYEALYALLDEDRGAALRLFDRMNPFITVEEIHPGARQE